MEEWTRRAKEAKTEGQVWEIIKGERRKRMNEGIEMEEWRCFMRLLGEVEGRVKKGSRKGKERDEEEELGKM